MQRGTDTETHNIQQPTCAVGTEISAASARRDTLRYQASACVYDGSGFQSLESPHPGCRRFSVDHPKSARPR